MMLLICSLAMAQSQYISYREYIDKDRKADLLGASGILIYSQQGDLIITLTNVKKPMIQKNGKGEDGLYEYEIIIEPDETRQPKLEITKRGGVDRQSFIAKIKPDFYKATSSKKCLTPFVWKIRHEVRMLSWMLNMRQ